MAQCLHKGLNK